LRGHCHHAALRGVVFTWCCVAVVFVASRGRRLRMALPRRRLRAALRTGASSHGVVRCCPHTASHSCCTHMAWHGGVFASPRGRCHMAVVFTCHRMAAVVFTSLLLSRHCRLHCRGHCHCLVAEQSRAEGAHTFLRPRKRWRGCAGAGRRGAGRKWGDGHAPASARTLFAHEWGAGRKEGVPWAKGGHQRSIGGGGKARGHIPSAPQPSAPPQTAGAVQGQGVPLHWHESCSRTNRGALGGRRCAEEGRERGSGPCVTPALTPFMRGQGTKRGGLACNKGVGGSRTFPCSAKGPCSCVNGVGRRTRPPA
jgi:hypothetical protein